MSYGALALALAIVGGLYTWRAWRSRGPGAAIRGAGLTLLPIGLWLTGALALVGRIIDLVGHWLLRLVFSPIVWLGVVVTGLAIVLMVVGGLVARRTTGRVSARTPAGSEVTTSSAPPAVGRSRKPQPAVDDELAEIEAILKKRGIS